MFSALAATTLSTSVALACPYCAAQDGVGKTGVNIALGAFILLPFLVVGSILRFLRSERGPT
jgi:hypothetical protein